MNEAKNNSQRGDSSRGSVHALRKSTRRRRRPNIIHAMATLPIITLFFSSLIDLGPAVIAAEENVAPKPSLDQVRPTDGNNGPTNHRPVTRDLAWLKRRTEDVMSRWRDNPTAFKNLRPLDLLIDETDPTGMTVYQSGAGSFIEPFDFNNYQENFPVTFNFHDVGQPKTRGGRKKGKRDDNEVNGEGPALASSSGGAVVHQKSDRLGLTMFDLKRIGSSKSFGRSRALRGGVDENLSSSSEEETRSDGFFIYHEDEPERNDKSYSLLDGHKSASSHEAKRRDLGDVDTKSTQSSKRRYKRSYSDAPVAVAGADSFASFQQDETPPVVRATFPPWGTKVGKTQSFGALVSDSGYGVQSVCVQFKDHTNSRSACFNLINVASDVYELSFSGFDAFGDQHWSYRIKSKDGADNHMSTAWSDFIINIVDRDITPQPTPNPTPWPTDSVWNPPITNPPTSPPTNQPVAPASPLLTPVRDDNWPHRGAVQTSTGRILFFMDGNAYVCSGTVIKDGDISGRTIILTAAHCAFQYSPNGKSRFAENAFFIPNQVETTEDRTNEDCGDDPLGCWIPAFAVVDVEWTTRGFPQSVPWDYAYYVIPDNAEAHKAGYLPTASGILDRDVEPFPVNFDFNEDLSYSKFFTHALGYSFNKDPNFRYCATDMSTKFGISTYENYWLNICDMTGGSSGGPWLVDTDTDGRGTIISVNSWGYTSSSGMAGPNLSTQAGSKAECLLEKAKIIDLDGVNEGGIVEGIGVFKYGGFIVDSCY